MIQNNSSKDKIQKPSILLTYLFSLVITNKHLLYKIFLSLSAEVTDLKSPNSALRHAFKYIFCLLERTIVTSGFDTGKHNALFAFSLYSSLCVFILVVAEEQNKACPFIQFFLQSVLSN